MDKTLKKIRKQAQKLKQRIVLPEGEEARTLKAVQLILENQLARPVLLGDPERIQASAQKLGLILEGVPIVFPEHSDRLSEYAEELYRLRKSKGMTKEEAYRLAKEPLYFGALMLRSGEVDGLVAGAVHTTAAVLRAVMRVIGLAPGSSLLSSSFLMLLPTGQALTYADCGVVPYPTADQLAQIAIDSAAMHRLLTGEEPRIAMLSFSTKGSAEHESVSKVRQAAEFVRQLRPDLCVDGELQFDAAYVPEVASRKAPESPVAGKANVLIFPNLDAGNIAYKITERLAGARALGPILQGAAKPVNDLSRGASAEDIADVVAICSVKSLLLSK
ncbi:MAG: phosphate acetyltransferase [Bacteroidetes bacterium]|nr:phosphate acetyltransferase [Bacteroidota bacterium]